eukprot:tig00001343_g8327.t1
MNKLAADLVSKFAARFLKNFDSSNVDIGLLSGDIRLTNVELNPEALDSYNLPIIIKGGHIGEVRIDIPWTNLKSKPTTVHVDRVCVVLGTQWNMDKFVERDRALKARAIIKHARKVKALYDGDDAGAPKKPEEEKPFKPSVLSDILFNVRVSVTNVHVRFEDDFSNTWHPWALGVTVEALTLETSSKPQESSLLHRERYVTKRLALSTVSVYWDSDSPNRNWAPDVLEDMLGAWMPRRGFTPGHAYVMRPLSVEAEVALRKTSHARPTVELTARVEERVELRLQRKQYDDALALAAHLRNYGKSRKCLGLRPRARPRHDPRAWWHYAGRVAVHYVRYCTRRFAWKHVVLEAIRRDAYCQAYHCYLAGREGAAAVLLRLEDAMAPSEIIGADGDGGVFLVGRERRPLEPAAEWAQELAEEEAAHAVKGAPPVPPTARRKMLLLKEALLGSKNPMKIKVETHVREVLFAFADSRQMDVVSGVSRGIRTTLAHRVNSTKLDCTVEHIEAFMQNTEARAQVLTRLAPPGPEAAQDPSWTAPMFRLTLEHVAVKEKGPSLLQRLLGAAGAEGEAGAAAGRDEWAVLVALGPMDLFLYGPLLEELKRLLHRPWPEFVYKQWPRSHKSKMLRAARPAKHLDHSIKLVLGGTRVKVMLEQAAGALFFHPEGTVFLPALEVTYSSRDYASAFGFLRSTAIARTPLLASFLGAPGTDAHRDDAGAKLQQLAHAGGPVPGPAFREDEDEDSGSGSESSERAAARAARAAQEAERARRALAQTRLARAGGAGVRGLGRAAAEYSDPRFEAAAAGRPLKMGYVERRARFGLLSIWRRRWLVLLDAQLACYESPAEFEAGVGAGEVYSLRDVISMGAGGPEGEPEAFALVARCEDDARSSPAGDLRTLHFRCPDPAAAADWMRCLAFKGVPTAPGAAAGGAGAPPGPSLGRGGPRATAPRPSSVHGTAQSAHNYAPGGPRVGPLGYPVGARPVHGAGALSGTNASQSSSFDAFLAAGPAPAPHGPAGSVGAGARGRASSLKPGEGSTSRYPGQHAPAGPASASATPRPASGPAGPANNVYPGAYGGGRFASAYP